jgi:predicted nucleic acid-binding protein
VTATDDVLVVDTSAVIAVLAPTEPNASLARRLVQDGDLQAPHLLDIEFLHTLRRLTFTEKLSQRRADDVRADFRDLPISRYPQFPFSDRIWQLRHNLTPYDAASVALAETLAAPLVSCERRMAGASGHSARVELFHPSTA